MHFKCSLFHILICFLKSILEYAQVRKGETSQGNNTSSTLQNNLVTTPRLPVDQTRSNMIKPQLSWSCKEIGESEDDC